MADWTTRAAMIVAGGAALGGVMRYLTGTWLTRPDYPWGTLAVNVVGSFIIGIVLFGGLQRGFFGADARLFFATGVLGAFTTMSAFSHETVNFLEEDQYLRALGYVSLTFFGSLGAAFVGRWVASMLPVGA